MSRDEGVSCIGSKNGLSKRESEGYWKVFRLRMHASRFCAILGLPLVLNFSYANLRENSLVVIKMRVFFQEKLLAVPRKTR